MSPALPDWRIQAHAILLLGLGLFAAAVGTTLPPVASAHARSISYSNWVIDSSGATVSVRMTLLELSRLGPETLPPGSHPGRSAETLTDPAAVRFPTDLLLVADGTACAPTEIAQRRPDAKAWIQYRWRIECPPDARSLVIHSRILLEAAPSHMHFARVRFAETPDRVRERVLTEASPNFEIWRASRGHPQANAQSEIGSDLADYIRLGVDHILSGWDHLAFVFGLLLLATRVGEVARLITGFTLAHSLTLALAVQGLVHPRAAAVEAAIAFSVALVAIEKGWLMSHRNSAIPMSVLAGIGCLGLASFFGWVPLPGLMLVGLALFTGCYFALALRSDSSWLRFCLTFAFGLVHGFGFAGILVEMSLPADRLVPALIGFNLGVELGQIGIILVVWPLLKIGGRYASIETRRLTGELSAAGLCGLGLYWLASRAFSFS